MTNKADRSPVLGDLNCWDECSLHSTEKTDSAIWVGAMATDARGVRPLRGHSERLGGRFVEEQFAASMNQSLIMLIEHSPVSRMLRGVSARSPTPTKLKLYSGG